MYNINNKGENLLPIIPFGARKIPRLHPAHLK